MPGRPRTFHLDALILKHTDYGEADRIMVVFSNERGKVRAIAKGVRKVHSRKAGHLEPFTHTRLFLAQARDMPIITQAESIDTFDGLRNDLTKIGYASYVFELVDRFSSENEFNHPLFCLIIDTIKRIVEYEDVFSAIQYFELHLLDLQGFKPELFVCVKCKKTIQAEDQYFSTELGGVLCPQCGPAFSLAQPISLEALKYLRHYQRSAYFDARRPQINPQTREEMSRLTRHYLTFLLERKLNSIDFIKDVARFKYS